MAALESFPWPDSALSQPAAREATALGLCFNFGAAPAPLNRISCECYVNLAGIRIWHLLIGSSIFEPVERWSTTGTARPGRGRTWWRKSRRCKSRKSSCAEAVPCHSVGRLDGMRFTAEARATVGEFHHHLDLLALAVPDLSTDGAWPDVDAGRGTPRRAAKRCPWRLTVGCRRRTQ